MKKLLTYIFFTFLISGSSFSKENLSSIENLFFIDQMNSHDENFALYFKPREKAILAKGEVSGKRKMSGCYVNKEDFESVCRINSV